MRRSVKKAIDHWLAEGLLSAELAAQLGASLEEERKAQEAARATAIFGSIGAVLTGLGVILFVGSNWAVMSPLSRSVVLLGAYALVVVCAVWAERRKLPQAADAVWLLATLVMGANIFLLAQTYNMSLTVWQGTLAWTVGAFAVGYARGSWAQAAIGVPLAILTIGWMGGGSGWFFDDQVEFLFTADGLRPVLPLLALGLIALSTLVPRRDDLAFLQTPSFRWGILLVVVPLLVTSAHVDVAETFFTADFNAKQIVIIVVSVLLVAAAFFAGKVESQWSKPAMAALAALLLVMLIPSGDASWVGLEVGGVHLFFGLYVVALFAMALFTIWLGINGRDARLVNIGMISTTLLITIQYFGWSFQMLDRSLAFILGGIVLIGLSIAVEKKRRRIMAQIAA